jgi:type VII secretion-associated serine protease mycosin
MAAAVGMAAALAVPAGPALAVDRHAQEWYLDSLHIPAAHKVSTGKGVTVAVIDSGVDATHPDLAGVVLPGIDMAHLIDSKQGRTDMDGHGTAMASVIAGQGGGPSHIYGIAPDAKILPIIVGSDPPTDRMAKAIRWATDHGASVINISLGLGNFPGDTGYAGEVSAVKYALDHNVVVVAGSGNNPQTGPRINDPANIPGVVGVTGTDKDGEFWSGSASGKEAGLAAPATKVPAAVPAELPIDGTVKRRKTGGYALPSSGTSNSAAIVSGVAALVRSKYPKLDAINVIHRLTATADDKGPKGRDAKYGFGVVDPVRALTADVSTVHTNPLGSPGGASSSPPDDWAAAGGGHRAAAGSSGALTGVLIVVGVVVVLGLLLLLVLLVTRRNRRAPADGATQHPVPPTTRR